jgi:hypothetical protein
MIALKDTKLADLHRRVKTEIERRTRTATNGHDATLLPRTRGQLPTVEQMAIYLKDRDVPAD